MMPSFGTEHYSIPVSNNSLTIRTGAYYFGQKLFAFIVSVQYALFTSFLVINHEIESYLRVRSCKRNGLEEVMYTYITQRMLP